ncbi:MAG: recombinase family protein [Rhodoferax sp.]|nr:recombinase family protein [Rhodoferax sp.]
MTNSTRIAYYRVSTTDQSIESQRSAMGGGFAMEFKDEGVSGAVLAAKRPGFAAMLHGLTKGATVCVYSVDRLGRDAIDVQATVRQLLDIGVSVHVHGLGLIAKGAGELILAVLAQVADMERHRINERTAAGRQAAKESLALTGLTHKGKASLGRPHKASAEEVVAWRWETQASLSETAEHWGLSLATVKRYWRSLAEPKKEYHTAI